MEQWCPHFFTCAGYFQILSGNLQSLVHDFPISGMASTTWSMCSMTFGCSFQNMSNGSLILQSASATCGTISQSWEPVSYVWDIISCAWETAPWHRETLPRHQEVTPWYREILRQYQERPFKFEKSPPNVMKCTFNPCHRSLRRGISGLKALYHPVNKRFARTNSGFDIISYTN